MNNKRKVLPVLLLVLSILIIAVSMTYAYFEAQGGDSVSKDIRIHTHTTDLLEFEIDNDIEFEVTQQNFTNGGNNVSDSTTATAILTPNSGTGEATDHYYMYLNIETNEIDSSLTNTNGDPELLLQVFDENGDLVEIDYFDDTVEYDDLEGYDITGMSGTIPILEEYEIEATGGNPEEQEWTIVITMINLDIDQEDNTGKEFEASIIMQKGPFDFGFTGSIYRNNLYLETKNGIHYIDGTSFYKNFYSDEEYASEEECKAAIIELGGQANEECEFYEYSVGEYEITNETLRSEYVHYLKHEVVNNIITDTQICFNYESNEYCIEPNYWVPGDTDGTLTLAKFQNEFTTNLIDPPDCDFFAGVSCGYESIGFTLYIRKSGALNCLSRDDGYHCMIDEDGVSYCTDAK